MTFKLRAIEDDKRVECKRDDIVMAWFNYKKLYFYLSFSTKACNQGRFCIEEEITEDISNVTLDEETRLATFTYNSCDFRDVSYILESRV